MADAPAPAFPSSATQKLELFKKASENFRSMEELSDDDIRVLMRASGASQCRRMLGIGHDALLSLDGQYRQRIATRDAALNFAKAHMTAQGVVMQPPTVTSKTAVKGDGKGAAATLPKPSTTPPPPATRPGASSSSGGQQAPAPPPLPSRPAASSTSGGQTSPVPKEDPPLPPPKAAPPRAATQAKPANKPTQAAAKKTAQPVVKRPPVIQPVDPLAAVFTEPFIDSVAADVDLMVYQTEAPKEEPQVHAAPPRPDVGYRDYLDMIAPDLEFHMQAAPAPQHILPPVPGSSLASSEDGGADNDQLIDLDTETEEDPMDDPAEQDQGDDDDGDDQGPPRIVQRSVLCTAPATPPWDSGAAASSAATVGDTEQGQQDAAGDAAAAGDTAGGQTAPVQDPPVAPAPQSSWPPQDQVAREARRAARRQREVDAEARWADEPDPCNVLPNETSTIWSLPPGVPEQPVPSRYADSRVHGFCNLGCETPKRHRTDVCLGHADISVRVPHVFSIFLASQSAGAKRRDRVK
ncbi:unnamed protein product [Symbiodinium sp. CCMP2456]|nr:unnamed protein product [Symbiodinium sp. CCMP2456]